MNTRLFRRKIFILSTFTVFGSSQMFAEDMMSSDLIFAQNMPESTMPMWMKEVSNESRNSPDQYNFDLHPFPKNGTSLNRPVLRYQNPNKTQMGSDPIQLSNYKSIVQQCQVWILMFLKSEKSKCPERHMYLDARLGVRMSYFDKNRVWSPIFGLDSYYDSILNNNMKLDETHFDIDLLVQAELAKDIFTVKDPSQTSGPEALDAVKLRCGIFLNFSCPITLDGKDGKEVVPWKFGLIALAGESLATEQQTVFRDAKENFEVGLRLATQRDCYVQGLYGWKQTGSTQRLIVETSLPIGTFSEKKYPIHLFLRGDFSLKARADDDFIIGVNVSVPIQKIGEILGSFIQF